MIFKLLVVNYFFVCAYYKMNIVVGLLAFLILLRLFSHWIEEYRLHVQGQKDCASDGLHSPGFVQTTI